MLLSPTDVQPVRLYNGHNRFDIWDHGVWDLRILLATRSFSRKMRFIGNNSVIFQRDNRKIASNVTVAFTMFVRVCP